jgi:4'-phosphopantetheinyl transferase
VGRGVLRALLGRYLGVEPGKVRLQFGAHGKPGLAPGCGGKDLRFNVTHSQDLALYAFARGRELGIDLEQIRPLPDADQIASGFFSARESAAYKALPVDQRREAFFRCWTRKEAYIKALGGGLALPLDEFDVSLAPGKVTQLLHVTWDSNEISRWSLVALEPAPGYVSTLAVEGRDWRLACWRFGWTTPL